MTEPESESIRQALDQAWRDHHHVRDQTWRAVQIEAVLAAGLVTVDLQYKAIFATALSAALVVIAGIFGILISLNHRDVEVRKFLHISNLEKALGLIRKDLIPPESIRPAEPVYWWHIVDLRVRNTAAFILRMHAAIIAFAILVLAIRIATIRWGAV